MDESGIGLMFMMS